ncbi:hypothetical protein [uncultured Planktosalinus sp.]|uniref:hypothetical protein n=1 Tax=uncultured Planktosalinus sp. TaxID=1810935 RepID=UPI0030DCA890|tara:strand:+ start:111 stop:590 length:480 start_codon:yes stop_codon:yes gene_type:complete
MKAFKESQKFNQWWLKLILIIVILATAIPVYMIFNENTFEEEMFWPVLIPVIITAAAIIFIFVLRLETTIDSKGIHYKFYPVFGQKTIPWNEISECYVRTYSPLAEFGGWGIRWGFNGKAYNIKGNKGIQVVIKSGKKILFGTQKENEAKNVIEIYFNK